MSHPKAGDVVLYRAFGRTSNAIVLAARYGEPSHLGKSGEPLLTLAFIDPSRETGLTKKDGEFLYPIGRVPNVFIEHDVVHASHEFSDEFFREKKIASPTPAIIASHRGHGEWSEVYVLANEPADVAPAE